MSPVDDTSGRAAGPSAAERHDAWLAHDPDETTRTELRELIEQAGRGDESARRELVDAFGADLRFGTAGVRAKLGPGPNRMNRVVVRRITAGVAHWLREDGCSGGRVVVGYDGRRNSADFAADVAAVLKAAGFDPVLYDRPVPTPVLAYAAKVQAAAAAVMITASHNPADDNGYKLYDATGSQILPDTAMRVEALIRSGRGEPSLEPVSATSPGKILSSYRARVLERLGGRGGRHRGDIRIVYSAMHGVGGDTFTALCADAGFDDVYVVREQHHPNGAFPTTRFPNPEEPGALDLAVRLAVGVDADLILANDPDADRCAVALPDAAGGYRRLSGDTVGALLLWWLVRCGRLPAGSTVASSVVSSELLADMAAHYHLLHEQTLTGFKWIARVPALRFGYEEAIGYCLDPEAVGDKDGVSAAIEICAMAATLRGEGRDLAWALGEIDDLFGAHRQRQLTVARGTTGGSPAAAGILDDLPDRIGGLEVVEHYRLDEPGRLPRPTEGMAVRLGGNGDVRRARVLVRPSGTEPKVRVYLEVVAASADVAEKHLEVLAGDLRAIITPSY